MLPRERYLNTLTFKPVDRIPLMEWPIRKSTMDAWIDQGYPEHVPSEAFFNLDTFYVNAPIHMSMLPVFEERILEQNQDYKIWQDDLGAIRKDFLKDATPGFVTRSWLEFPVKNSADFLEMKKRYNAGHPHRYPANWKKRADILNKSHVPVHLSIPFLFWTTRDWVGFENLCMMFYDQSALVEEMFTFITDFCIDTLKRGIQDIDIDIVELKEDMAYKHAPMISPAMFKKFMLPHYVRLIDFLKSNGVRLVYVDCDGYPGGLIPHWLDAGVDAMSPCEIAAGNDLIALRKKYPGFGLFGGIDKRELAKGKKAVYHEVMSKVPYMIEKGGYIPHIDHAVPPDIPLENYLYFRELMTRVAYGREVTAP